MMKPQHGLAHENPGNSPQGIIISTGIQYQNNVNFQSNNSRKPKQPFHASQPQQQQFSSTLSAITTICHLIYYAPIVYSLSLSASSRIHRSDWPVRQVVPSPNLCSLAATSLLVTFDLHSHLFRLNYSKSHALLQRSHSHSASNLLIVAFVSNLYQAAMIVTIVDIVARLSIICRCHHSTFVL